jgi:hypothetical protein
MSVHETASHIVAYHQQDTAFFCGAATAQMVLDSVGAGLIDQGVLFNSNTILGVAEAGWFSPPDGLASTMQAHAPTPLSNLFDVIALPSEDALSRKLCWSIHNHGIAPIALVFGDAHWIVVTGYTASATPMSSDDTSYQIESFDIHNPFPPVPSGGPPPHGNGTDNCGTGGHRGVANELVVYQPPQGVFGMNYWRNTYMTGVPAGFWGGKFVAICDSDPPATTPNTPPQTDGEIVTDANEIIARAERGIADFGLNQRDSTPDLELLEAGEPLLVEREDFVPLQAYYLVPYRRENGEVPFLANVGAHQEGAFAGAIGLTDGSTHFSRFVDRATVIQTFAGRSVTVGDNEVTLRAEDLDELLVWRPCVESLSPYWPFYRFSVGGPDSEIRVYVRIDGVLFPELHVGSGM